MRRGALGGPHFSLWGRVPAAPPVEPPLSVIVDR